MYKKPKYIIKHESVFPISFHDTDAMGVVWHGNYIKFFELAREAMFIELGYDYNAMEKDALIYPVTECKCIYRHVLKVTDKALKVVCMLENYDAKVTVHYEVYAKDNDKTLCAYGYTEQVAMNVNTQELQFQSSDNLVNAIENYAKNH